MLNASNISLSFGKQVLFKDVNVRFTTGNCYGVIGANGAGKSTFLKILSKEIEPSTGDVSMSTNSRLAVLQQDQFKYDDFQVLDTVFQGHPKLYKLSKKREEIYSKSEMTEEEGLKAAELEAEFGESGGYEAETQATSLLKSLSIPEDLFYKKMQDLEPSQKIKVLLAQAVFGNPDVLILDEPTNNLDIKTIKWLENFLSHFPNVVIVVSHDRYFLNNICTHIADIDFHQIKIFAGNYDFWYEMSQLYRKQFKDENKKKEDKAQELKKFIQRFSSNASKAKQATSRKKLLDKLTIEDVPRTSRKFPYVSFKPQRDTGKIVLNLDKISYSHEGEQLLNNVSLNVQSGDKIAVVSDNSMSISALFDIITEVIKPDSGSFRWGETITSGYFPKDNSNYFEKDITIIDWLRQYTENDDDSFVRGFLGRMLFLVKNL